MRTDHRGESAHPDADLPVKSQVPSVSQFPLGSGDAQKLPETRPQTPKELRFQALGSLGGQRAATGLLGGALGSARWLINTAQLSAQMRLDGRARRGPAPREAKRTTAARAPTGARQTTLSKC